eukprot:414047_1
MITVTNIENIDRSYHKEIIESNYALLTDVTDNQIKEVQLINGGKHICSFDTIENINLLLPFVNRTNKKELKLFVQPKDNFDFVLFKTFYIYPDELKSETKHEHDEKLQYLLSGLKMYPNEIDSAAEFFSNIGLTWNNEWIPQTKKIFENSKDIQTTKLLLNRFINELNINEFPNLYIIYGEQCTLGQLICILTHPSLDSGTDIANALLICHKLFTESDNLLQLLIDRFTDETRDKQHWKTQNKICSILLAWIQHFWVDDIQNQVDLISQLESLIKCTEFIHDTRIKSATIQLTKEYNRHKSNMHSLQQLSKSASKSSGKMKKNINDYKASIIAEQFTVLYFKLFQKIKSREFVYKDQNAPNIANMTKVFNETVKWVQLLILNEPNFFRRVKSLKLCVSIAKYLKKHNNFSACLAFLTALDSIHIRRLRKCWKRLNVSDVKKFKEMQKQFGPTNHWELLRKLHSESTPPTIFHLDLILKDLESFKEEQEDYLDDAQIPLKLLKIYETIFKLTTHQKHKYELKEDTTMQYTILQDFKEQQQVNDLSLLHQSWTVQTSDRPIKSHLMTIEAKFDDNKEVEMLTSKTKMAKFIETICNRDVNKYSIEVLDMDMNGNNDILTVTLAFLKSSSYDKTIEHFEGENDIHGKCSYIKFAKQIAEFCGKSTNKLPQISVYGRYSKAEIATLMKDAETNAKNLNDYDETENKAAANYKTHKIAIVSLKVASAMNTADTKHATKLLLLGSKSSYKSVLLHSILNTYATNNAYSEEKSSEPIAKHNIRQLCVVSMLTLLKKSHEIYAKNPEKNRECMVNLDDTTSRVVKFVVKYGSKSFMDVLDYEELERLGEAIFMLWSLDAIQATFNWNGIEYTLPDNMNYFFNKIQSIMSKKYVVSIEDAIKCPVTKSGVMQYRYQREGNYKHVLYDICRQSEEGNYKKYMHHVSDVAILVFVCSLSDYDMLLCDDESTNVIHESIKEFHTICLSEMFKRADVILILTKANLFKKKLKLEISLEKCFGRESNWTGKWWNGPNYTPTGDNNADKHHLDECFDTATDFIKTQFLEVNRYPHVRYEVIGDESEDKIHSIMWTAIGNAITSRNIRIGGLV